MLERERKKRGFPGVPTVEAQRSENQCVTSNSKR